MGRFGNPDAEGHAAARLASSSDAGRGWPHFLVR